MWTLGGKGLTTGQLHSLIAFQCLPVHKQNSMTQLLSCTACSTACKMHSIPYAIHLPFNLEGCVPSLNELGSAGQMSIDFHRGIVKLHGAATQGFCPLYGTGSGTPVVRMVSLRLSRNVGTSSVADSVPSPSLDVPRYPLLTSPGGACAAAPLCAVRRSV